MNAAAAYDTLTIVNGPEDGTEFALTHRRVTAGADPACAVNVRLDEGVLPVHGRLMAVGDGYRIRATHGARVLVNGHRVGVVRSRTLKHGDIVRLGETDLALTCNPGGLAQRSRGTHIESDLFWAAREGIGITRTVGSRTYRVVRGVLRFMRSHPVLTAAGVLTVAYWRVPVVHAVLAPVVAELRGLF